MTLNSMLCGRCGAPLEGGAGGQCWRCMAEELLRVRSVPAPLNSSEPLLRLGNYELLEEIARGGMGVVFRARQIGLDRQVAIKVMRETWLANGEDVRRFRAEAAAAAKLRHPNIVAIHEVGEKNGQHYFAMDLVEGINLAERTRDGPIFAKASAELLINIAEAVQHAHAAGVLHRDLKPSNILLDAEEKPYVTDFGLTRPLDADSSLTGTGQVLGTPGYMPPEQASGRGVVGPAADIYSLGALLFHLLTGRAPFSGVSNIDILRQVLEQEPVSPKVFNPAVPRDLASVCLRCLAKEPARRYASAQAFADDLRRFLRGEPTRARPAGRPEQFWRWCQRKPALAGVSFLAAAALLAIAFSLPAYRRAEHLRMLEAAQRVRAESALAAAGKAGQLELEARQKEREQRDIAREALSELTKIQYINNLSLAEREYLAGDPDSAEALLDQCPSELRAWEWAYLKRLCWQASRPQTTNSQGHIFALADSIHSSSMSSVAFSRDGKLLACLGNRGVNLCDLTTGRDFFAHKEALNSGRIAFNPKNDLIAFGSVDFSTPAIILNTYGNGERQFVGRDDARLTTNHYYIYDLAFSPDGKHLATCQGFYPGALSEVNIWNASGSLLDTLGVSTNGFNAIAYSPDGRLLAAAESNAQSNQNLQTLNQSPLPQIIRIWDVASGRLIHSLEGHKYGIWKIAFTPDGTRLASASGLYGAPVPGEIKIWDVRSGKEILQLAGHKSCVFSLAISPDGKRLASGGGVIDDEFLSDGNIHIWDLASGRQIFLLKGHTGSIHDLVFSSDGSRLASASSDGTARVWDATVIKPQFQIDLSSSYNAAPWDNWIWPFESLADLPKGIRRFEGVRFEIRGIVQLKGKATERSFPLKITDIGIHHRFHKIHFLHATGSHVRDGTTIGRYVLRYTDGHIQEIPIVYGVDLREWKAVNGDGGTTITRGSIAWSKPGKSEYRVFKSSWANSLPQIEIGSLDFVSAMTDCYPFLIAITVEE